MTTGKDYRLVRLGWSLSAKERGLLVLRSWKEGKDEDPSWRNTMPPEQVPAFNRYIGLMNAVNRALGLYLILCRHDVEKLGLHSGWLATLNLWQLEAFELAEYIMGATKEPVTESRYRELQAKAAEEYWPVAELAYLLTERHDGFEPDDLEGEDERSVRSDAWGRVQAEKAKEIARLVAEGALVGRGRGKALTVQAGSFYAWLGEPVPALPEWAFAYDVRPDEEADDVAAKRGWRSLARDAYRSGPTRLFLHLPGVSDNPAFQPDAPSKINDAVQRRVASFKEGVLETWRHVRAVEILIDEIGEEFGEDPCVPDVRQVLDEAKGRLAELHQEAERYVGEFALEEPGEELVGELRRLTERELL